MAYQLSDTRQVVERSLFEALRSAAVLAGYLPNMNAKNQANISALNQGSKTFTINGTNLTQLYLSPRKFNIIGSTGNDGEYTVSSSIFSGGNTIITVLESIANSTADGKASIYQYYDDSLGVSSFLAAQQAVISANGFVVEVFGVGSPRAKYQKKVPRIVLIPNQSLPGGLGGNGDPVYTPVGSDPLAPDSFTKHVVPPQTVDFTHDVHIVTASAEQARVCHGIVSIALPKRGYVSLITDPTIKFFVESFSYRNIPNPGDDIMEDVYMYKSSDMYETSNNVSDEVIKPITDITLDSQVLELVPDNINNPSINGSIGFESGVNSDTGNNGDISVDRVYGEVLAGLINNSNATFTTEFNFVPGTEEVFVNGLLMTILEDYNTTGTKTIVFFISPEAGDELIINYDKKYT